MNTLTLLLMWVGILVLNAIVSWGAGYALGRLEMMRAVVCAFKYGHPRCELQHGASVQRGYVLAHADLSEVMCGIPKQRWWHAFRRPVYTPTLPGAVSPTTRSVRASWS